MKDLSNLFDGEAVRIMTLTLAHFADMIHSMSPGSDEVMFLTSSNRRASREKLHRRRTYLTILTIDYLFLARKFSVQLKGQKNPAFWSESRARSDDLA